MVHTRLSIVDLKKGYQPINNNKLILVANGEIYNDPELRNQYSDFNFKTNSDSESILAVYQSKGLEGFEELRGMYAFALFDTEKDQLIISRDEFGIKPLYFSVFEDGIIFCSELNPLKKYIPFKTELENKKVIEHLQYQYCTGNKTIFKNINRLRPGETLIIKNGKIIESKFRTLKVKRKNTINDKFFKRNILNSVSSHLRSDVPYCLFFSGGIDSMLLLYCIKQLKVKNVTAFTINFENKTDNNLKNICTKNNIKLRELNFLENDFWDLIFFAAEKVDDPIADYAILPTIKLSEIASKDFKVVITGEGGDELFGGYGRYKKTQRIFFRGSEKKETFKVGRYFQKLDTINSDFNKKSHLFEYKNVTRLQKKQLLDYKNWLPNNLLIKLDRCLMAYSLEGRTPFIDKNLFKEFFFIKDNMKVRSGFGKFYVRKFLKIIFIIIILFRQKKAFQYQSTNGYPKKKLKP